jgi:hypothetical protein
MEQNQTQQKMKKAKKEIKFNSEDYKDWQDFRNIKGSTISNAEYEYLCVTHAKYYEHKVYKPSKCCGQKTLQRYVTELNQIYDKGL